MSLPSLFIKRTNIFKYAILFKQAFPHHFLVLRRGINPNIQYNLSPVRGLSRPYGYHPTKRIRPAVINPNGPMEPVILTFDI